MDGPRWLLSVDPGTHSAWALWECVGIVWELRRVGRMHEARICEVTNLLGELLGDWRDAHVVVEGQWHSCTAALRRQEGAAPWPDVVVIVESRCAWEYAAELAGASVEVVPPATWIRAMTAGIDGADSDARIKAAARARWPQLELEADEHAAVLLGTWWTQRAGVVVGRATDAEVRCG